MDDVERSFNLRGETYRMKRSEFVRALEGQHPMPIQTWAVDVAGRTYPPKQVFRAATKLTHFTTHEANRILRMFGFRPFELEQAYELTTSHSANPEVSSQSSSSGETDARVVALEKALQFYSVRPDATAIDVVNAAGLFETWLTGTHGRSASMPS